MLEICEIGEQGVSIVDFASLVRRLRSSEGLSQLQLDLQSF
jgi:hypothetical protein